MWQCKLLRHLFQDLNIRKAINYKSYRYIVLFKLATGAGLSSLVISQTVCESHGVPLKEAKSISITLGAAVFWCMHKAGPLREFMMNILHVRSLRACEWPLSLTLIPSPVVFSSCFSSYTTDHKPTLRAGYASHWHSYSSVVLLLSLFWLFLYLRVSHCSVVSVWLCRKCRILTVFILHRQCKHTTEWFHETFFKTYSTVKSLM